MTSNGILLIVLFCVAVTTGMNYSWREVEDLSNANMSVPTGQNQRRQANNVWRLMTQIFDGSEEEALEFCLQKCGKSNVTDSEILNSVSQNLSYLSGKLNPTVTILTYFAFNDINIS